MNLEKYFNKKAKQELKVSLICEMLLSDFKAKFVSYRTNNKIPELFIDLSIEDKISWEFQNRIQNFLSCTIKFIDKDSLENLGILNNDKTIKNKETTNI